MAEVYVSMYYSYVVFQTQYASFENFKDKDQQPLKYSDVKIAFSTASVTVHHTFLMLGERSL